MRPPLAKLTTLLFLLPSLASSATTEQQCTNPSLPTLPTCLAETQKLANLCKSTEYECLCERWGEAVYCFDDCDIDNDPREQVMEGYRDTFCSNEAVYGLPGKTATVVGSDGAAMATLSVGADFTSMQTERGSESARFTVSSTVTATVMVKPTSNAGLRKSGDEVVVGVEISWLAGVLLGFLFW